jgi:uncharacterized protein (TIGR03435 family)
MPDPVTRRGPRALRFIAIGVATAAASMAYAQQHEQIQPISFVTASVKSSANEEARCAPNRSTGQMFTVTNCALGELILFAYDVLQEQVSGPSSLLSEKYDVVANAGHAVSRAETRQMLQSLLTDRFKLSLRRETRQVPVYALVVGENGPKFEHSKTPSEAGPKPVSTGAGQLFFQNTEMSDIVFALSRRIRNRIVVDKTGLTGKFDCDMTWYLKLGKPNPPSVFTAVQELGLKLEPRQSPVDFIAIDHAETPSDK